MGKVRAGVCPRCGSANTWIGYKNSKDGYSTVRATCGECGFEDARLRGGKEDGELLIELAKKSFSTVYLDDSGKVGDGMPGLEDMASDISNLVQIICNLNVDCGTCPLHVTDGNPTSIFSEGGFAAASKMGIACRCHELDACRRALSKMYPGMQG